MSQRWRRLLLAVVAMTSIAVAAASAWTAFERSFIPYALDGTVDDTEGYTDSGFRLRIVTIDGADYVADTSVASKMFPLDRVQKDPWSTTLVLTGAEVHLTPSAETWVLPAMAVALPAAAFAATRWLDRRWGRAADDPGPADDTAAAAAP